MDQVKELLSQASKHFAAVPQDNDVPEWIKE